MTMRKVLAWMALIGGTASADAAETQMWCSSDNRQVVVQLSPTTIVIDGRIVEETQGVTIENTERYDGTDTEMLVYRARVFSPCPDATGTHAGTANVQAARCPGQALRCCPPA
jgi:hypothetical protein